MAHCEICGKDTALNRCKIEGCEMSVCVNCSKFGKIVPGFSNNSVQKKGKPGMAMNYARNNKENGTEINVSSGAGNKIKNAREAKGLTQEQLAKAIAEKASVIQRIESGHMSPAISTAEKLERFLGISIVEETEETETRRKAPDKEEGFTIADLLKKK
ncbi:MAG: multiprotein bridging factor aMBF1 [Nanoarchaeota archaeon]